VTFYSTGLMTRPGGQELDVGATHVDDEDFHQPLPLPEPGHSSSGRGQPPCRGREVIGDSLAVQQLPAQPLDAVEDGLDPGGVLPLLERPPGVPVHPRAAERVVDELTPPVVDADGDLEFPVAAASEEPIPVFRQRSQSSLRWSSCTIRTVVTPAAQGGLHFLA
jgi:hypothetical protein